MLSTRSVVTCWNYNVALGVDIGSLSGCDLFLPSVWKTTQVMPTANRLWRNKQDLKYELQCEKVSLWALHSLTKQNKYFLMHSVNSGISTRSHGPGIIYHRPKFELQVLLCVFDDSHRIRKILLPAAVKEFCAVTSSVSRSNFCPTVGRRKDSCPSDPGAAKRRPRKPVLTDGELIWKEKQVSKSSTWISPLKRVGEHAGNGPKAPELEATIHASQGISSPRERKCVGSPDSASLRGKHESTDLLHDVQRMLYIFSPQQQQEQQVASNPIEGFRGSAAAIPRT